MQPGETPLAGVDAILVDLDGVVYKGDLPIAGAVESLSDPGIRVGYITNNASRTAETVADHLQRLGLPATAEDVVTSSQAAARLLMGLVPAGSEILVVGGEGLTVEVERAGLIPVGAASSETAAVVQGFAPDVGWHQLAEAAFALQGAHSERPWVATNSDWTIPVARGVAPGNGTLVSAVHTAVGRLPVVAGKPETPIFTTALERFSASKALFVGDRLDTDILGANRAGIRSALVLTGIDGARQLLAADATMRPDLILENLTELVLPYPAVEARQDGTTRVRDAVVRLDGRRLELEAAGAYGDLVRAASAAVWNSGMAIYAIDVTASLLDALRIAR
ncbi:HAD-IIA family hydrolase [Salinibacterium sp. SYSU T00001]|uniref:HAD-IIA family hydrolase n=1 Tax=Homoserinimonas sedimenticola TaxID=2986805 RepID=UPI002236A0C9|nr:HAD-IIA family hydrolase [Salinibacterium sedimenticola]MCW4384155.1 HAD-IIA family hydrolase [Salinibacterium sedimenticola]